MFWLSNDEFSQKIWCLKATSRHKVYSDSEQPIDHLKWISAAPADTNLPKRAHLKKQHVSTTGCCFLSGFHKLAKQKKVSLKTGVCFRQRNIRCWSLRTKIEKFSRYESHRSTSNRLYCNNAFVFPLVVPSLLVFSAITHFCGLLHLPCCHVVWSKAQWVVMDCC